MIGPLKGRPDVSRGCFLRRSRDDIPDRDVLRGPHYNEWDRGLLRDQKIRRHIWLDECLGCRKQVRELSGNRSYRRSCRLTGPGGCPCCGLRRCYLTSCGLLC